MRSFSSDHPALKSRWGGHLNLDGGTLNLDGGANSPWGDASPLRFKYWLRLCSNKRKQKGICKFSARFLAFFNKTSSVQKIVLSSSRGQGNFRGLEVSRPRLRT